MEELLMDLPVSDPETGDNGENNNGSALLPKERLLDRLICYVYPMRSPHYDWLVRNYPSAGDQAVIKVLMVHGWKSAKAAVRAYQRRDEAWLEIWRHNLDQYLLPADIRVFDTFPKESHHGPTIPVGLPILEIARGAWPKPRYNAYLKWENVIHRPIIRYYNSISEAERRSMFVRTALVVGARYVDSNLDLLLTVRALQ